MKNEFLYQTPPVAAAGSAPELLNQALNENSATEGLKAAVSLVKIILKKLGSLLASAGSEIQITQPKGACDGRGQNKK